MRTSRKFQTKLLPELAGHTKQKHYTTNIAKANKGQTKSRQMVQPMPHPMVCIYGDGVALAAWASLAYPPKNLPCAIFLMCCTVWLQAWFLLERRLRVLTVSLSSRLCGIFSSSWTRFICRSVSTLYCNLVIIRMYLFFHDLGLPFW